MSEHIIKTINDLQKKVEEHELDAARLKTTINELCGMAGIPVKYANVAASSGPRAFTIRSDQFHGRPLATVVREYLELRRGADMGPASTGEIFEALQEGGYEFNTKTDEIGRISLSNSLRKNSVFYTLPNKRWGLAEWYPNAKKKHASEDDDDDETKDAVVKILEARGDIKNLADKKSADQGK